MCISKHSGTLELVVLNETCCDSQERANLLDVMLASSRSSSSSTSSGSAGEDDDSSDGSGVGSGGHSCSGVSVGADTGADGCNDTTDDSSDDERDANEDDRCVPRVAAACRPSTIATVVATGADATNEESYNRLHKLHRVRRQKKGNYVAGTDRRKNVSRIGFFDVFFFFFGYLHFSILQKIAVYSI